MNQSSNNSSRWRTRCGEIVMLVLLTSVISSCQQNDLEAGAASNPVFDAPSKLQKPAVAPSSLMTSVNEFDVFGHGDETDNIQRAIDSGRSLFWPEGTYTFSKDLYIRANTLWQGSGYATHLVGNGAGVRVDADPDQKNLGHWKIANMRLGRVGELGSVLFLGGSDYDGKNYAAIRGVVDSVWIDECNSHGVEIAVAYIIDLQSMIIRNCAETALYFHTGPGGNVSANAIKIFGGELQNNGKAVELQSTSGISFFGTTIEGNSLGVDLSSNARQTSFFGSYFEANGGYDISAGSDISASGLTVSGGVFWDGGSRIKSDKSHAILLYKAIGVNIQGVSFSGYSGQKLSADPETGTTAQPSSAIAILSNPNWVTGTYQNLNLFDTSTPLYVARSHRRLKFHDVNSLLENFNR